MKNRVLVRKLMMVAGLMAALAILFSSTLKYETHRAVSEVSAADESKDDSAKLSAGSTDAVTSSQAVEVESVNPYVVQEIITELEHPTSATDRLVALPVSLVTSLLKTVISPQAP